MPYARAKGPSPMAKFARDGRTSMAYVGKHVCRPTPKGEKSKKYDCALRTRHRLLGRMEEHGGTIAQHTWIQAAKSCTGESHPERAQLGW